MKTSCIFSTSQQQWNVRSSMSLFPQGFPSLPRLPSLEEYTSAKQHLTCWHCRRYQISTEFRVCAINEELPLNSKIAWKLRVEEKWTSDCPTFWLWLWTSMTLSWMPLLKQHIGNAHTVLSGKNEKTQCLKQRDPQGLKTHSLFDFLLVLLLEHPPFWVSSHLKLLASQTPQFHLFTLDIPVAKSEPALMPTTLKWAPASCASLRHKEIWRW